MTARAAKAAVGLAMGSNGVEGGGREVAGRVDPVMMTRARSYPLFWQPPPPLLSFCTCTSYRAGTGDPLQSRSLLDR